MAEEQLRSVRWPEDAPPLLTSPAPPIITSPALPLLTSPAPTPYLPCARQSFASDTGPDAVEKAGHLHVMFRRWVYKRRMQLLIIY